MANLIACNRRQKTSKTQNQKSRNHKKTLDQLMMMILKEKGKLICDLFLKDRKSVV